MANYSKQWSTASPGYLIFLIDQSDSMSNIWFQKITYATYTAEVINKTINELIAANAAGETIKNRVFISLIGYGGGQPAIKNLRSDYIANYANKPIRIQMTKVEVENGQGGTIEIEEELPIFLEPQHHGYTPMSEAFEVAKKLIESWIQKKNDNPVPVIINISDGRPQGATQELTEEEIKKTIACAKEIMKLSTLDGSPLLFNVHIGNKEKELQFPETDIDLANDRQAKFLYNISSTVPQTYRMAAKSLNLQKIGENAKGFISNSSPENFIKFINFGSSGGSF